MKNFLVVLSKTPTRTPYREGFPFRHILTDLRGMSIFKMTDIFGFMENLDFEPNLSIWSIFPWKWHGKVGIILLTSFEVNSIYMYEMDCRNIWFSRSPLQILPYSHIPEFTYFGKNLICGLIFEISADVQKLETFSYIPSKYEVNRTETRKSQAISKCPFLLSHHGTDCMFFCNKKCQ